MAATATITRVPGRRPRKRPESSSGKYPYVLIYPIGKLLLLSSRLLNSLQNDSWLWRRNLVFAELFSPPAVQPIAGRPDLPDQIIHARRAAPRTTVAAPAEIDALLAAAPVALYRESYALNEKRKVGMLPAFLELRRHHRGQLFKNLGIR